LESGAAVREQQRRLLSGVKAPQLRAVSSARRAAIEALVAKAVAASPKMTALRRPALRPMPADRPRRQRTSNRAQRGASLEVSSGGRSRRSGSVRKS
jgi:hypothetical protein